MVDQLLIILKCTEMNLWPAELVLLKGRIGELQILQFTLGL